MRNLQAMGVVTVVLLLGAVPACEDDGALGTPGAGGVGGGTAGTMSTGGSGAGFSISSSGPGGNGGAVNCGESTVEATLRPANILFVVDRSGSMLCNAPPIQSSSACELNPVKLDPNEPSKWDITAQALKDAFAAMPSTTSVGVAYFNNDDGCGVDQVPSVPVATLDATQLGLLVDSIDGVVPKGPTPIVGGVTLGYAHLHYDIALEGNDFLVLFTDGKETCASHLEDKLVDETVPMARSVNIRTFVIGAPGSDPARALLSRIAWAGGTAGDPRCVHDAAPADVGNCHIDLTDPNIDFATELANALAAISGQALGCEFDVPSEVGADVDYNQVNVQFTGGDGSETDFAQDNGACDMADGWQYNADRTKIILCGAACELAKSDPDGKVKITLGCDTVVK